MTSSGRTLPKSEPTIRFTEQAGFIARAVNARRGQAWAR